jgi:hypothetical protein
MLKDTKARRFTMKTHTHYTTPIATAPWMRRNLVTLSALLALAAALVGLVFALEGFGQIAPSAMKDDAAIPAHPLIATCRFCADEALGAAQTSQASLTLHTIDSAIGQYVVAPRAFRDEMLGADQANLASLIAPDSALDQPQDDARQTGPR